MTHSGTADFRFVLQHRSGEARAGYFETARGRVLTPVFMPVATHAALRAQYTETVEEIGYRIILGNTYHLLLRPGPEVFELFGGIHEFMRWPGLVLTDSGGYQLFSLSKQIRMAEEGATFRSYVDGSWILLSPEASIGMQRKIGSDIMMALDQCIPAPSGRKETEDAMRLTHRWAERSLAAREGTRQALFGIVQGGCFEDLRRESAACIASLPFDGYAIGGVAVGEEIAIRNRIVAHTAALLPQDRPRYLMGVGTPLDLLESVARGVDMFDCIIPTAHAQHGRCYTWSGRLNLDRTVYAASREPIDPACRCPACRRYSRAYLHHLCKAGEALGHTLIGAHNLAFFHTLMSEMRRRIEGGSFDGFYTEKREILGRSDAGENLTPARLRPPRHPAALGSFEIHKHGDKVSVRHRASGEIMHSVTDPELEAEALYIAQSGFRRLLGLDTEEALAVWDVGLGAGTNAMAAIAAYESLAVEGAGPLRPLRLVSFENDMDALRLAAANPTLFRHVRHQAPHAIIESGEWRSPRWPIEWTLAHGDFLELLSQAPAPDLIFFDPFSYKTNPGLWTLECFDRIYRRSKPGGTILLTYSASTGARAGLLAAGFHVASGIPMGPKESTTVALRLEPGQSCTFELLDRSWLERWERSGNRFPAGLEREREEQVSERVRSHPQFDR